MTVPAAQLNAWDRPDPLGDDHLPSLADAHTGGFDRPRPGAAALTLEFRLDMSELDEVTWSVTSPELPSLYVCAERLVECSRLAHDVLHAAGLGHTNITSVLADSFRRRITGVG